MKTMYSLLEYPKTSRGTGAYGILPTEPRKYRKVYSERTSVAGFMQAILKGHKENIYEIWETDSNGDYVVAFRSGLCDAEVAEIAKMKKATKALAEMKMATELMLA